MYCLCHHGQVRHLSGVFNRYPGSREQGSWCFPSCHFEHVCKPFCSMFSLRRLQIDFNSSYFTLYFLDSKTCFFTDLHFLYYFLKLYIFIISCLRQLFNRLDLKPFPVHINSHASTLNHNQVFSSSIHLKQLQPLSHSHPEIPSIVWVISFNYSLNY